jgi:hypothetical protein
MNQASIRLRDRLMCFSGTMANQRSTRLSDDALDGVKGDYSGEMSEW